MVIHQGLRMEPALTHRSTMLGQQMAPFGACASSCMAGFSWQSGGGMRLLLLSAISSILSDATGKWGLCSDVADFG